MTLYIIDLVEKIEYREVFIAIGLYLLILWSAICGWVLVDAYKRYSKLISIIITLLVAFLGPPALIFYIMIRPEHTKEERKHLDSQYDEHLDTLPINFDYNREFEVNIKYKPKSKRKFKVTSSLDNSKKEKSKNDKILADKLDVKKKSKIKDSKQNKTAKKALQKSSPQFYTIDESHNNQYFRIQKGDTLTIQLDGKIQKHFLPQYNSNLLKLEKTGNQISSKPLAEKDKNSGWNSIQYEKNENSKWSFLAISKGTTDMIIKKVDNKGIKFIYKVNIQVL